jgi:transcriptional regulator with XRE-family HTH domain
MKVKVKEATGVLADLLANINEKELAKTRKRMMLAAKIEEAMKRCGYNQTQFAHLMKKSTTVISEWLSGDRNFTTDTLMDIEDALGIRLLDTSIMTAVNAGTEISLRISANAEKSETMSLRGTWGARDNYRELEYQVNCA